MILVFTVICQLVFNVPNRVDEILSMLRNPTDDYVFVAAHRGDWRNAPENSLQSIENCINIGVDIVEVDIRRTKDGYLILMHDETVNRTTNGKGFVHEMSFQEIRKLNLVNSIGIVTHHRVPTLKEALDVVRNRILINLDKSSGLGSEILKVAHETGTVHQIILKGWMNDYSQVIEEYGDLLDSVIYMPVIDLTQPDYYDVYKSFFSEDFNMLAMEFTFKNGNDQFLKKLKTLRASNVSIWLNALWPEMSGGHHDERGVYDKEGAYGWLMDKGANIIQTDRPQMLLEYLRDKDLHH